MIKEIIEEYSKFNNTDELLEDHYKKEKQKLYLTRLMINNILKKKHLTRDLIRNVLITQLQSLVWSFEETPDNKDMFEFLEGFNSIVARLSSLSDDELDALKLDIYSTFCIIWELIGTYNYYKSCSIINSKIYYDYNIDILKDKADMYLMSLLEHCPKTTLSEKTLKLKKEILE
jgi:hypothetical protein